MSSNRVIATQTVAANLKVDGSAVTQPVSGTVTANAGTNLNTSLLATAAKQPALGTAGTASADVITVQGVASGYPLAIGLNQLNISQTPTTTNGAYSAEDVIGGLLTFANAARVSAGSGQIAAITIMCKSPLTTATVPALELAFFNQTFTNIADNGVWGPSDADMANCIGTIPIAAWNVTSNNCIATRFGLNFPYTLTGTSLFAQLITHTAVTLTSTSDIIIGIQVWRD